MLWVEALLHFRPFLLLQARRQTGQSARQQEPAQEAPEAESEPEAEPELEAAAEPVAPEAAQEREELEDLEDMLRRCREEKAEERGLRERLWREGYKEDVLRKASLPDLKYYVSRESWGHPERDPNYPSGRVERQAYVQQLHEKGFDNWGELTPANLAKPQS